MKLLMYLILGVFLILGCKVTKKSGPPSVTQIGKSKKFIDVPFHFEDCDQYLEFLDNIIETNLENKEISIGQFSVSNAFRKFFDPVTREKMIILEECIENMHLNDYIKIFGMPNLYESCFEQEADNANIGISAIVEDSILTNVEVNLLWSRPIE